MFCSQSRCTPVKKHRAWQLAPPIFVVLMVVLILHRLQSNMLWLYRTIKTYRRLVLPLLWWGSVTFVVASLQTLGWSVRILYTTMTDIPNYNICPVIVCSNPIRPAPPYQSFLLDIHCSFVFILYYGGHAGHELRGSQPDAGRK